ncbi:unnamed protein product [Diabrotica balteata]|uniref:Uncharacterized protein n=1 Tax=Diabrotica balteata TaxID=107213 RepID=A0A9N9X988_DIABA|nr:unnamed protein product [Diabrotica balteata]
MRWANDIKKIGGHNWKQVAQNRRHWIDLGEAYVQNPKPPQAPQNVTVGPLVKTNGSLNVLLKWTPPISDLPIERYKVFWSRRLQGAKALDSVLVQQQVLSKEDVLVNGVRLNNTRYADDIVVFADSLDGLKTIKSHILDISREYGQKGGLHPM